MSAQARTSKLPVTKSVILRVPLWHPTRINVLLSLHPKKRGGVKKRDYRIVWAYYAQGQHAKATTPRRVTLTIVKSPRHRGADTDAYWKVLCDALVACGALVDDKHPWVELAPVQYRQGTAKEWGSEIVLTDLAPEAVR